MKTIREWLESIEDETIRQQALSQAYELDMPVPSMDLALMCGIAWSSSSQGSKYWDDIYSRAKQGERI